MHSCMSHATALARCGHVHARARRTCTAQAQRALSGIELLFLDNDELSQRDVGGEEVPPGSLRSLPLNRAPATHFTVDNVAEADAMHFKLHNSVHIWANVDELLLGAMSGGSDIVMDELFAMMRNDIMPSMLLDTTSAAYWAYHGARTTFFTAMVSQPGATLLSRMAGHARDKLPGRLYQTAIMCQQDLANIKARSYTLPWDMLTPNHPQHNPVDVLARSLDFVLESVSVLDRRAERSSTANWLHSNMYPEYYTQNTFHYQTDGWFSTRSAELYDFSTETLFAGCQDVMQRTALLPIAEWLSDQLLLPEDVCLLEVGCGTGRFHTHVKENYPGMKTVASELSPFYLAHAREHVNLWHSARSGVHHGDHNGTGTGFMQCAAESIPAPNATFDIVVCNNMLHEMPEDARVAAAAEFARVLRPGGLCIISESVQLGDRPYLDATLGAFGAMNEPHYRSYIACNTGALMRAAGLIPDTKYICGISKTLSFRRGSACA